MSRAAGRRGTSAGGRGAERAATAARAGSAGHFRDQVTSILAEDSGVRERPPASIALAAAPPTGLHVIPVDLIGVRSDQPRRSTDPEALEELVESVRLHGVLQPIRVRVAARGRFEVIAGERRLTAAQRAGLSEIPALVVEADDDQAFIEALIENVQREDLNAVDRAHALVRLREQVGATSWEETGRRVGIGRRHVHRLLGITALPVHYQDDIRSGVLTEKHARALLLLRADEAGQEQLWRRIHADQLSGDAAIAAARGLGPARERTAAPRAAPPLREAARTFHSALEQAADDEVGAARRELSRVAQLLAHRLRG